jgi:hypothetical protein
MKLSVLPLNRCLPLLRASVAGMLAACALPALASLEAYDSIITNDAATGLPPVARLTNAVTLTGANRAAFNFGTIAGNVTMEFILAGNPAASPGAAYLAVGANASSNLRYEQFSNTGQLGFTQLGVADYLFAPAVPSPVNPTHIAYVWNNTAKTMTIYVNGALAGMRSSVSASFAMPAGQGYLGANPGNTENMTGTIYRLTSYNDILPIEIIQQHSDAYHDIVRPPVIASFSAHPTAIFTPASSTLSWDVQRATAVFINGMDVTTVSNLTVSPTSTTTYTLIATNSGGSISRQVTLLVNPAPVINSFTASRTHIAAGETVALNWNVSYGETFFIAPTVGDVTAQTISGIGSVDVQPSVSSTYILSATNNFGGSTAQLDIVIVQPADHLVISEFMADDESTLADEDGQFSGWIEIFNPTASDISLAGHFLTDEASDPTKWAFPNRTLNAGAYLIVFASGKDRTNSTSPLHANFNLNNAGEYLALIGPGPIVLHAFAPAFPAQREDVSYGILGGDPAFPRYMGIPTPGTANNETPAPPPAVLFSVASGLFVDPFAVSLSTPIAVDEIRFTLDGSVPGATNGAIYTTPIAITNTTRIRAAAIIAGQSGEVSGAAYLKLSAELANYTSSLPIMVIDNFGAGTIPQKGWTTTGAGVKQTPRQSAVWATFDRVAGSSAFTNAPDMFHLIGIRGRGAFSSQWRQKPYSVEGIDEDGNEANMSPLGMPAHADWILYFPDPDDNKDPTLMFNTFAYELSKNTGHYAVRFRWVEAFVNEDGGELRLANRRGVYAIMEKVSRGRDRLDFQPLSSNGMTGSWLLNLNRMDPEPEYGWPAPNGATQPWFFHTAGPNRIAESPPNSGVVGDDEPQQSNGYLNFDNPNGYTINTNQRAAIELWFKQFEDVLWNNSLWRDPINGYRKYLDPVDFADYFVLNVLTRNGDGLLISMFPWKGDDGKLRMGPAWDYNWNPYYISGGPTGTLMHRSDRLWYRRLFADPDFLQLYIDRWWDMRRGAMSNAGMDAIIDGQMNEITPAKAVLNGLASGTEWTNRLGQMKTWLKTRADWIDSNYLRPPFFNVPGGEVPDGFQVAINGTNGTIYFTIDGSDPRVSGGSVAPNAQLYAGPVPLASQTTVSARIRNGTNWSGLTRAVFYTPQDLSQLAVTEIMYNPASFGSWGPDELEFLELKNIGTNVLQLGTLTFGAGITFTFTNGTRLDPGQFFVLARNATAFASRYPGHVPNGIYTGRLDNGGETLRLETQLGNTVLAVTYNDRAPWPLPADGYGFSAVPRNLPDNSDNGSHWRASSGAGGSPHADDPPPTHAPVVINEVLTHTDPPDVDAIELFNPTAASVDIGGWFLSDDGAFPKKFRIPTGTMIPAGGFRVFTEADFNPTNGTLFNFALDSAGDSLYLTSGDSSTNLSGYGHGITFGAAANGVSFGRYVNSVGEEQFPAQLAVTLEAANAGPIIGPVVISEIMYHPDTSGDEFIELRNITANDIPLFDVAFPSNTWRINGLGFTFPTNIIIPSNGLMIVTALDPEAFRGKYAVNPEVQVIGPFAGQLQDNGERLELQRPDVPDTNGVSYITVDEVRYNDKAPWPPGADGGGPSLQRLAPAGYGNDPINWQAAIPTPGIDFVPGNEPIITSQPQNRTIIAYQDVTFTVTAAGQEPLSYQWLFNGDPIAGATSPTLLLTNVQPANAGRYHAVVYNAAGSASSASAQLFVRIPATIQQQPQSLTNRLGLTATFTVSAIGTGPLRYQWLFNGAPIINLPSATNSTLTLTNVQLSHGGIYSVVITDNVGPVTSLPARLMVVIQPVIVQSPVGQTIVAGSTVTLSVVVSNSATLPLGYRLRRNSITLQDTFISLNQHTAFFTITNVQAPFTNYAMVVTNVANATGVLTTSALLTLLADSDGDGLPDTWENAHGFNPTNATDRALDADGDTMLNWQEYLAGTDPTNALSYLKVEASAAGGGTSLSFFAVSNRTYTIQVADDPQMASWRTLTDIAALRTNRVEAIADPSPPSGRFYRLVTPRQTQ